MQENPLKASLLNNSPTLGCWLTLDSTAVAEVLAHCGFEWLVIDMEHGPSNEISVTQQIRAIESAAARGINVSPVVRVTANDPSYVKRAMDAGASNILFPNIMTAAEARLAAQSMRYPVGHQAGSRGVAGIVRAAGYGMNPALVASANDRACTIVQIESAEAVDNVEEIARVDGVDCLFIGPADLAASLGHFGDARHQDVQHAIITTIKAAEVAGKATGIFAVSPEEVRHYRNLGVSFISLHSDVAWLASGASSARAMTEDEQATSLTPTY
ncbi:HpcH/HpaI aldolase family protein [Paenarthrobacter sp. AB444]|uniref:HpcH/HpaI aldolase family protein n=1 Tax=Paenarthrobacter sp. AB444 TaxID=3025681 RepID=UPI002366C275|nr:aldolase/citrate lyase family protein [Paenarthrobacter sp. AB444]MDD7833889.1 aldolase/citrate lyase family protein [Paenarthrobacter sp. AB444]